MPLRQWTQIQTLLWCKLSKFPGGVRVAKPEWGVKRLCQSCATKFYDLSRSPIACPQCGARFDPEALLKSAPAKPGSKWR